MTEFVTNIAGDVEKLVTIGKLNGDIINYGTIYLTASFDVYKTKQAVEMSVDDFQQLAKKYHESLKETYGKVKVAGYPENLDFKQFYINPLFKRFPVKDSSDSANNEGIVLFDIKQLLKSSDYIYINGAPGSGKTILLKYILTQIEALEILSVPIFITLNSFKSFCSVNSQFSLYDYIFKELKSYGFPSEFVNFMLKNGLALILMDGLDEIYVKEFEKSVIYNLISDFNKLYKAKILVTSRCLDFDYSNPDKVHYQILPFNRDQIHDYLNKTLSAEAKSDFLSKLNQMHDFTFEDRNRKDNLEKDWASGRLRLMALGHLVCPEVIEAINEENPLPQVASTPLLLSILILNYRQDRILCSSKTTVFRSIVDFIIRKWFDSDGSESFRNMFTRDEALQLLYYISFCTLKDGNILIGRQQLYKIISRYLKDYHLDQYLDAADVIKTFKTDLGIIADHHVDQYKFIHPVIQEYLSAQYLCDHENYHLIFSAQLFLDSNWSEVIGMVTETLRTNTDYLKSYIEAIKAVSFCCSKVRQRIDYAFQKSGLPYGPISLALFFYHICISVMFQCGHRVKYSCIRITHKLLSTVYGYDQIYRFSLCRFTGELTRLSIDYKLDKLFVDSWILQIYDTYTDPKIEFRLNVREIINKIRQSGVFDLTEDLLKFDRERKKKNNDDAEKILLNLLTKRGIITHEVFETDDLNILSTFIDLIEMYLIAVPDKDNINRFLNDVFSDSKVEFELKDPKFSNFLTSFDYSYLADQLYLKNDMEKCLEYSDMAIKLNPDHAGFYFSRGATLSLVGNDDECLKDLQTAVLLNEEYKNDVVFQRSLGIAQGNTGDFENALISLRHSLSMCINDNDREACRWHMSGIYMHLGAFELAIESLQERITFSKKILPLDNYTIAYCYLQIERYEQAILELKPVFDIRYFKDETLFIYVYCKIQSNACQEGLNLIWHEDENLEDIEIMHYILLLKCFKILNKDNQYTLLINLMREKGILAGDSGTIKIPVSPGHVVLKFFDKRYFMKDFEINYDLNTLEVF